MYTNRKVLGWGIIILIVFTIGLYFIITDVILYSESKSPPHIVIIIADDVGFNDFSFHGSNEIPTPNIDALGYNGIILDKFYTQPSCSPSRAALLTGKHPIRYGLQGDPIIIGENINLPTDIPLMSEHLNKLGYISHIVGKWHLGFATKGHTPTRRGFASHLGYWNGYTGYFDYGSSFENTQGFDLHNPIEFAWADRGKYATDLFTETATDIIDKHNEQNNPLFLLIGHLAAHTAEGEHELGVPNITETNSKYAYLEEPRRRRYAEIINILDNSVGKVAKKLADKGMLENSIILFFSDNGGPTVGASHNTASNWPLRGIKITHFEGGIRGSAVIFSPLFKKTGYISKELMHLVDILPTFYEVAGGKASDLGKIDGVSQWETLSENRPSKRTELLVDIDDVQNVSSIISDGGKYKLIIGNFTRDATGFIASAHLGRSGRDIETPPYNISTILKSFTNIECEKVTKSQLTEDKIIKLRSEIELSAYNHSAEIEIMECVDPVCLFDLESDPCEVFNIADENPEIVHRLRLRIDAYWAGLVPQNPRLEYDTNSSPKWYNNTWCTWLEDEWCPQTKNVSIL